VNVFVETNFVLELALEQHEREACERILDLAANHVIHLFVPAYSLVEPHETLTRRHRDRQNLRSQIATELTQLARSAPLAQRANASQEVVKLLVESAEHETKQLGVVKERIWSVAEILPLTAAVLRRAVECQSVYDLSPQDAVVYASVRTQLDSDYASQSCFISRNPADFDDPDLQKDLATVNCKYLSSFANAVQFIAHAIKPRGA
jgi:predicted nucleic acid-binding protein